MRKVSELPYKRVQAQDVLAHIDAGTQKATHAKSGKELAQARTEVLRELFHYQTMAALAEARFTLNTRDAYYTAEKEYYDETAPKVSSTYIKFENAFLHNEHVQDATAYCNPIVLERYRLDVQCNSDEAVPHKIEENRIVTEYTKLMAETLFSFRGENMPLSALRKYFFHPDRAVRKEAYTVLGNTLAGIGDRLDDIYDRLVKVRTRIARVLGYDNYVALGDNIMGRFAFSRHDLHTFRENVLRDIVPMVSELKKALRKKLRIQDDFMLYDNDTYFPQGNPTPVSDAQGIFAAGKAMYADMSRDTGEFFDYMLQTDAFDVFPREGKWGGGYCTSFVDYRQPFILANFNGTSDDVDVLTHEAGHAFADYMLYKQGHDAELNVGGMETAETHSMSMEFFAYKYMRSFFGDRAEDYKYAHLFEALNFLPYGTIVDYFQEEVYAHPDMTSKERNELWNELERKFRPWMTTQGIPYLEKGTRWQYQMHIFENPLYYIDYCLAQSVALQFLLKSQEDYDKAFAAYIELLRQGGERDFPTLVRQAGLRSPFAPGALHEIAQNAKQLLLQWEK